MAGWRSSRSRKALASGLAAAPPALSTMRAYSRSSMRPSAAAAAIMARMMCMAASLEMASGSKPEPAGAAGRRSQGR